MRRKVHGMTQNVPRSFDFAHLGRDSHWPSRAQLLTNLKPETFEGWCAAIRVRIEAGLPG